VAAPQTRADFTGSLGHCSREGYGIHKVRERILLLNLLAKALSLNFQALMTKIQ